MKIRRITILKILAAAAWAAALGLALRWVVTSGIPLADLPQLVRDLIRSAGIWAPLFLIGMHVVRTFIFVPTTALAVIAGAVFGPVWGSVITAVGETLSASIAFGVGRFFGRRTVREREREHAWIRRYDDLLTHEGFITILAMRLLFFPFDPVNYLSGVTGITYRQYATATFIGLLPAIVTVSVLGQALGHPGSLLLFALLCLVMIGLVVALRRSRWVKEKLFAKRPEHEF